MSGQVFHEIVPRLAEKRRVLVPDLPGHGRSSDQPDLGLAALAAAIGEFCRGLGVARPHLLGWSLGGMVALEAARDPELAPRSLVLVAATPRFTAGEGWPHGLPEGQVKAMARDLRSNYAATMGQFFKLMFAADEVSLSRYQELARGCGGAGRLVDAAIAQAGLLTLRCSDLRPVLAEIASPCLVLHGDQDRIVPVAAGRYLAEQLPRARWQPLADCGHAPFLSRPEAFCRSVVEFLA
jgi:pimeloyl-[acyl-carrier protein] methyl ester esterase